MRRASGCDTPGSLSGPAGLRAARLSSDGLIERFEPRPAAEAFDAALVDLLAELDAPPGLRRTQTPAVPHGFFSRAR